MNRRRFKTTVLICCGGVALLLVGSIVCRLSATLPGQGVAAESVPKLVAELSRRDLGTVSQGVVLRAAFPVANHGTRRLVIVEQVARCCGGSSGTREIIVAPGQSRDLRVEVDTASWFGRLEHTVRYTTNDRRVARFAVTVTADVKEQDTNRIRSTSKTSDDLTHPET